jgi:exodeoxyribonuclease VII small subunit
MARNESPEPGSEPSFEDALHRLEAIVEDLERGELTLNESLKAYEEGMKLSKRLNLTLDEAEQSIQRLVEGGGDDASPIPPPAPTAARPGKPRTRPMDLDPESRSNETELPF